MFRVKNKKIFCIGANKTGTTSVERALIDHGFKMGNQRNAQDLIESYKNRDFNTIIKFCKTAEAFQDAPFSWHNTFMFLDQAFNDAKFILTVRDSAEIWYESFVNFHSKRFGTDGKKPTELELKNAKRTSKRTVWDNLNIRHNLENNGPYEKKMLIQYYNDHNRIVKDYFRFKDNLLIINLKNKDAYEKYCEFLGVEQLYENFPWENKTEDI